jgi:hypothetical protein
MQYPWDWLDDSARGRLANADLNEAISILADELGGTGGAGSAEDRQLLARSAFDPVGGLLCSRPDQREPQRLQSIITAC